MQGPWGGQESPHGLGLAQSTVENSSSQVLSRLSTSIFYLLGMSRFRYSVWLFYPILMEEFA